MESLFLFIEELSVGKYMGKLLEIGGNQFCVVARSWSGVESPVYVDVVLI